MTGRYFYVIAPVGADPRFNQKRRILTELGTAFEMAPFFPPIGGSPVLPNEAVRDMKAAEFVMADLSHERPSCYYEVGLAESAGVEVIIIAEFGTRIHQVRCPDAVKVFSNLDHYRELVGQTLTRRSQRTSVRG